MRGFELLGELLLVATVVALAARRIRLPYTVPLALAGVVIGLFPTLRYATNGVVPAEAALLLIVLPLVYEAALGLDLAALRARWAEAVLFGGAGTLLSILAVACVGRALFGL